MRKSILSLGSLILAASLAVPAAADGLSFGAVTTSDNIFRGVSLSGANPSFRAHAEYESLGFYGSISASTISLGSDRFRADAGIGYRWNFGGTLVDAGYVRSFHDVTGDAGGEFHLSGLTSFDQIDVFGGASFVFPENMGFADAHAGVSYDISQSFTVSAVAGTTPNGHYGHAGGTYFLSENVSLDARYHLMSGGGNRFQAGLAVRF